MFRVILLCLLTCCSSFMPLKQSESIVSEDHTQIVEKKTKENFVQTSSGYREYATSDLFAYDFLVGLVNYYVNDLGVSNMSYTSNTAVSNYVIQTSNVYQCFMYASGIREHKLVFNVSNIVMNKTIDDDTDFPKISYYFIFSNSSPYDKQFKVSWNAQRTSYNRLTIWGVRLLYSQNVIPSADGTYTWTPEMAYERFMLSENWNNSGYNTFIGNIFNTIQNEQYNIGYNAGYSDAYTIGYNAGDEAGYSAGYSAGQTAGYTTGYNTGVSDTIASGSEAMTIFAGIMDVAFIPVNVFFLMFNYEVFGINIAGFVSGLLTIAIVIILMRFIFGRRV